MHDRVWLAVGVIAQLLFFARFLVQWLTSERRGRSTIPPAFWYFSLVGGVLLLAYSIARRDPVFILGQGLGLLVYVRNIMLLDRQEHAGALRHAPWLGLAAFALLMGLAFSGSRGLWEPDEGRYAESAREMLASGDFMTPTLGGQPHYAKPPLTYWMIAGSIAAFGPNETAVRLPTALAFALTVMLVALLGRSLWGPRAGFMAAIVYATFVTTFAAANIVTPDTPLALWETLALLAFWRGFTAQTPTDRWLWPAVTGAAFGLAMLTKGPPGLLFLPAMLIFRALPAGRRPGAAPVLSAPGLLLFGAIGFSWFIDSIVKTPGLASYFIGEEVVGRVLGQHHRNHQWYGALVIYGPTLLLGAFPWCLTWPGAVRRWLRSRGGESALTAIAHRPRTLWLALAFMVPLTVLAISRSRLPLYLLPLFVPLALVTARSIVVAAEASGRAFVWNLVPIRWARIATAWALVLIAARVVFAGWSSPLDARRLYHALPRERGVELIVSGTGSYNGLAFYYARDAGQDAGVEFVRWPGSPQDGPSIGRGSESLVDEIAEESSPNEKGHMYVVAGADGARLKELLLAAGATIRESTPFPGGLAVLTMKTPGHHPPLVVSHPGG